MRSKSVSRRPTQLFVPLTKCAEIVTNRLAVSNGWSSRPFTVADFRLLKAYQAAVVADAILAEVASESGAK